MAQRKRIKRQQLKEDKFIEASWEAIRWIQRNRSGLIAGAAAALIIVGGAYAYLSSRASRAADALEALLAAQQNHDVGNLELAISDLSDLSQRYNGTPAATEAKFYLGTYQLEGGRFEVAVETLKGFLAEHSDSSLRLNATRALAAAYLELDRYEEAAQVYVQGAEGARFPAQKAALLFEAIRAYGWGGFTNQARDLLKRLEAEHPERLETRQARTLVLELDPPIYRGSEAASEGS